MSLPNLSSEQRLLLARCRERFAATLIDTVGAHGIRLPELLDAVNEGAHATFDELAGLRSSADFEKQRGLTASRISLVHMEDMDLTVALINLSQKLTDACERELPTLHLRFMTLLDQDDAVPAQVPVGPDAVCAVLRAMCDQGALDMATRQALPAQIEARLGVALNMLYAELNALMQEAGVEPKSLLRPASERESHHAYQPLSGPHAGAAGGAAQGETVQMAGPLGTLRGALMRQSGGGGGQGVSIDASLAAAIADRVLAWLTERQRDAQLAANLNLGELRLLLPAESAVSLDALGMALDAALADARLAASVRPALQSLRVPLLKAALIEPAVLTDEDHVARRMLDVFLALAMTVDPASPATHALASTLRDVTAQLARDFDRDLAIFESVRAYLEALKQSRHEATVARVSHFVTAAEREARREQSRRRAAQAIRALTASEEDMATLLKDFLEQIWVRVLSAIQLTQGEKGQGWPTALATADRLIWSMRPKTEQKERNELVAALPKLLEHVRAGLTLIGMPEKMREDTMQRFVAHHSAALHGKVIVEVGDKPQRAARVRIDSADDQPGLQLVRLPPDAEPDPRVPPWIEALQPGDWLDVQLPDGSLGRMLLAWTGGVSHMYLAAHPDREGAVVFPLRWLVTQAESSRITPVPTSGLLEAAAQAAVRKLR